MDTFCCLIIVDSYNAGYGINLNKDEKQPPEVLQAAKIL